MSFQFMNGNRKRDQAKCHHALKRRYLTSNHIMNLLDTLPLDCPLSSTLHLIRSKLLLKNHSLIIRDFRRGKSSTKRYIYKWLERRKRQQKLLKIPNPKMQTNLHLLDLKSAWIDVTILQFSTTLTLEETWSNGWIFYLMKFFSTVY